MVNFRLFRDLIKMDGYETFIISRDNGKLLVVNHKGERTREPTTDMPLLIDSKEPFKVACELHIPVERGRNVILCPEMV